MVARRLVATAFPAALACALSACGGGDTPTAVRASYAGTYRLATTNGQPPDTSVRTESVNGTTFTTQFTGEVLILRPDGTAADEQTLLQAPPLPPPCKPTSHQEGTWRTDGGRVTIDLPAQPRTTDCWAYNPYQLVGTIGASGTLTLQAQLGATVLPDVRVFTRMP